MLQQLFSFSLFPVTAAILQGINEQRFTVLSLLVGLLIKLTLNIPLIKLMETRGAILATLLADDARNYHQFICYQIFYWFLL